MKKTFIMLFVMITLQTSFGQYIEPLNPNPNLGTIRDVIAVDAFVSFITSSTGIYKSTDAGETWKNVLDSTSIRKSFFVSATHGWAITASGSTNWVLRTTNGGNSWIASNPFQADLLSIAFVSPAIGVVGGIGGVIYKTTNGGANWEIVSSPGSSFQVGAIGILPNGEILAADFISPQIMKYSDTWSPINLPGYIESISYSPNNGLFGTTSTGTFFKYNGSLNTAVIFNNDLFYSTTADRLDDQKLYTQRQSDLKIFWTTDAGITWSDQNWINNQSFSGAGQFSILGVSQGLYIEDRMFIKRMTNYNLPWVHANGITLGTGVRMRFANPSVGFLVGSKGVAGTVNGGRNWTKLYQFTETNYGSEMLSVQSEDVIYHVMKKITSSTQNVLKRSSDGGQTFIDVNTPLGSEFLSAAFLDINTGFVAGQRGKLFMTQNGGTDWIPIQTNTNRSIYGIDISSHGVGYAILDIDSILRTTNGGLTWTRHKTPDYMQKVKVISYTTALALDYSTSMNRLYRTTDGGETWTTLFSQYISEVTALDSLNFWVSGATLYNTTDGGTTWKYQMPGLAAFGSTPGFDLTNLNKYSVGISGASGTYFKIVTTNNNIMSIPVLQSAVDQIVSIPIEIQAPSSRKILASQFSISGFGDRITFIDLDTAGTIASANGWAYFVNTADGQIRFAASGSKANRGGGILIKLRVKIKPGTGNFIPFTFLNALVDNGTIQTDTINGGIHMLSPNYGDVDLNGVVQAYDAGLILQYLAQMINLNTQQRLNANVTADATITALDASVILRYVVRLITSLPYNGSGPANAAIAMHDDNAVAAQPIEVPVTLVQGSNIFSFESTLSYDPQKLRFEGVVWDNSMSGFTKNVSESNGQIFISGAAIEKFQNSAIPMIKLKFLPLQLPGNTVSTSIVLDKLRFNENPVQVNAAQSTLTILTSLTDESSLPKEYGISQNYPNPFNPSTTIAFQLPKDSFVSLKIFDALGTEVMTLVNAERPAGYHTIAVNASQLSSGIYFYEMRAGEFSKVSKMLLLK